MRVFVIIALYFVITAYSMSSLRAKAAAAYVAVSDKISGASKCPDESTKAKFQEALRGVQVNKIARDIAAKEYAAIPGGPEGKQKTAYMNEVIIPLSGPMQADAAKELARAKKLCEGLEKPQNKNERSVSAIKGATSGSELKVGSSVGDILPEPSYTVVSITSMLTFALGFLVGREFPPAKSTIHMRLLEAEDI